MSTNAKPFESPVIVALNATAKHRWHAAEMSADLSAEAQRAKAEARPAHSLGEGGSAEAEPGDIGRTFAAVIESTAAKIAANDFSGIEVALASQALTLDVIFDQYARRSARLDMFDHPMNMALRAQSQSRVTFKNLIALKNPRASQNSAKRTIETAKIPA